MTSPHVNCTGNLGQVGVRELLQWLHLGGYTAMLRVGLGLDACVAFFRDGTLYRCEFGEMQGDAAVAALLQLTQGEFCVIQRAFPEPRGNVRGATADLLANAAALQAQSSVRVRGG